MKKRLVMFLYLLLVAAALLQIESYLELDLSLRVHLPIVPYTTIFVHHERKQKPHNYTMAMLERKPNCNCTTKWLSPYRLHAC